MASWRGGSTTSWGELVVGMDVDELSSNPGALFVWDWAMEVFADAGTRSEEADSFGSDVGLDSGGATERDFPFFVVADCISSEVVAGVGDITGWRGGVATGIDASERITLAGA
jgi:hypothetical protein